MAVARKGSPIQATRSTASAESTKRSVAAAESQEGRSRPEGSGRDGRSATATVLLRSGRMREPAGGLVLSADVHEASLMVPIHQGERTLESPVRDVEPFSFARFFWPSRNFSPHLATLAGMASS